MDKETIMETLTLDRIQQDLKKKRNTYCIYTTLMLVFNILVALWLNLLIGSFCEMILDYHDSYALPDTVDSIITLFKSIVVLVAMVLYAVVGLVRLIRLSRPLQESSFVI